MTTEAQILANRLNAQKSTGPRTDEGKAAISQNAIKHGLTASCDVISSENQDEFNLYRDQLLAELEPTGPVESMLAERIIALSWRLKRIGRIQNQVFDALTTDNISSSLAKLTQSIISKGLSRPQDNTSAPDDTLELGRMAVKDFAGARVLDRLLMYERRIENSLHKTLLEIQRLNLIKKLKDGTEIPEPQTTNHEPRNDSIMQNKANLQDTQMNVTCLETKNYEQRTMSDEPLKQTQSNPFFGEPVEPSNPIYGELSNQRKPASASAFKNKVKA